VRVVFDTDIFVSALVHPGGRAEQALTHIIEGNDTLVLSKSIILETLSVLSSKFGRDKEELARVAVFLSDIGQLVEPKRKVRILVDDPDNRILECAQEGKVNAIVTGDQAMLKLRRYEGMRIWSLSEYLAERSESHL
jgi:putative PIN family toxin of toxin-antitoxin system